MENSRPTPRPAGTMPRAEGLYDPRFEHDSCGVGFVVNIKGERSHKLVRQAFEVSVNLLHRGACGCEANTGDGAGMLLQLPHKFFRKAADAAGFELPAPGSYGVGMVFLPRDADERRQVEETCGRIVVEEGQRLLGWRDVPTDNGHLGATARSGEPAIRQIFVGRGPALGDAPDAAARFERKLYVIRNRTADETDKLRLRERDLFYVASLSSNTIVYKGMLIADQVERMFPDLADPDVESALALVHSRFSTNTFPSWPLAHPYRYCAHNGEINTLRGNINWMRARESLCRSDLFGDDLEKLFPLVREGQSDTATFDNVLEFLALTGRPLAHAVLMMIPEPWSNHESMSPERKAFYEYHASLLEPWDGPASIAFTDGTVIGAVLDRNGLRALALLRDEGRHGDHGVRGGRSGHSAGERSRQGTAASRPHLPGRHGTGPDRRRRGDQARSGARAAVRRVAEAGARPHRRPAAGPGRPGRARGTRPHAAARLRLHRGGPADPDRADGAERRRTDRLDGHRHGAGGPLGSLAAALRLLQAALRPGDQPASRRDPRGAGHRHGLDAGTRGEPAGARRTVVPPRQGRRAGDHERRPWRSSDAWTIRRSALQRCRCCSIRAPARRASRRPWTSCAGQRATRSPAG